MKKLLVRSWWNWHLWWFGHCSVDCFHLLDSFVGRLHHAFSVIKTDIQIKENHHLKDSLYLAYFLLLLWWFRRWKFNEIVSIKFEKELVIKDGEINMYSDARNPVHEKFKKVHISKYKLKNIVLKHFLFSNLCLKY